MAKALRSCEGGDTKLGSDDPISFDFDDMDRRRPRAMTRSRSLRHAQGRGRRGVVPIVTVTLGQLAWHFLIEGSIEP